MYLHQDQEPLKGLTKTCVIQYTSEEKLKITDCHLSTQEVLKVHMNLIATQNVNHDLPFSL